jgi:RHS repeat-associated protein
VNGNQSARTLPDGNSTETFEYDDKGRLIKETSFEGVITTYQYDDYDRLESKTFLNKDGITETRGYTYDDKSGRVSEIKQDGRITKTTYDSQGRTVLIETPEGTISYEYDNFGRQISVKTDNDPPTYYTYDRYGRLATVSSDNETTRYEYDAFGNLAKTSLPNGIVTTYQYDNMNRLIRLQNFADRNNNGVMDTGEGVSEFSYLLDNLGRKDYAVEKFWTEYGEQQNEIDWEYDEAGRLIYEKFDHYNDDFDQTSEWLYDLVGNRLKQVVNGTETAYTYDANDRLLNEVTGIKSTLYRYDHTQQTGKKVSENGTLISETTFVYDLQGRMSVVTITTGNRVEKTVYEYGADGIRVSAEYEVWENGELTKHTKTEYLNDPLNITGYSQVLKQVETDLQTGDVTNIIYVIGHQRISQITVTNGTEQEYYFTFDGHGSTRALTDFAGAVAQLYAFDAYGNALGFNPSEALTEFLYSGEQFDAKIDQQYLRQRYYDSSTGRFNRLDPFFGNHSDPQSFHKYAYVHADPIQGIDPNGLEFSIGGLMGGMGISGNMRGMNQSAAQTSRKFATKTIKEFFGELADIVNFSEKTDVWSKKMAAAGEKLWLERLKNLGFTGFGMTGTPVGSHGPDLVAVKVDIASQRIQVIIGEIKALQSNRVLSALDRTIDDNLQMSFAWMSGHVSLVADMLVSAVAQAVPILAPQLAAANVSNSFITNALKSGEIDIYLLRARYYGPGQNNWVLRGFKLLEVGRKNVAKEAFDETDPIQEPFIKTNNTYLK